MKNLLNIFMELWNSNDTRTIIIIFIGVIIALFFVIIICGVSKAKKKKAYKQFFKKKLWEIERDESLNNAIEISGPNKNEERILIKLEEESSISKREHFFQLTDSQILMGASSVSCQVFLNDLAVDEIQCSLIVKDGIVVVKSYSDNGATVVRKRKLFSRKKNTVLKKGEVLPIKTTEKIILGTTVFKAVIYSNTRGLI